MTAPRRKILKYTIPCTGELIPALGFGSYRKFDIGSSNAERTQFCDVSRFLPSRKDGLLIHLPCMAAMKR